MQTLPLPTGYVFDEDVFELTGPPQKVVLEPIIESGRRRPVPRTLVEAFPISEGRRHAFGRAAADGRLEVDAVFAPRGLRAWITPDRVSWAIVIFLLVALAHWAYTAPKVGS